MSPKHSSVSVSLYRNATVLLTSNLARENIADRARSRESPSAGATSSCCFETQDSRRPDAIYNFRPVQLSVPPVTIYHPVFADFLDLIEEEPEDFLPEELDQAQHLITAATDYYKTEEQRRDALEDMASAVHARILSRKTFEFTSRKLTLDGAVCAAKTPNGFNTVSAITVVKNEVGDGKSDPLAQAECAYVAIYSSNEVSGSRCSRFLMLRLQC